jgi:hypothetical protein
MSLINCEVVLYVDETDETNLQFERVDKICLRIQYNSHKMQNSLTAQIDRRVLI